MELRSMHGACDNEAEPLIKNVFEASPMSMYFGETAYSPYTPNISNNSLIPVCHMCATCVPHAPTSLNQTKDWITRHPQAVFQCTSRSCCHLRPTRTPWKHVVNVVNAVGLNQCFSANIGSAIVYIFPLVAKATQFHFSAA